jgi:ketosteroid isomerase-like protein
VSEVDSASVREVVAGYLAALNAGDPDRVVACVTDDFVNEHTSALGTSSAGRDEYRSRLPGFFTQFEGLRYDVVDTIVEDDRAAVRYRMSATFQDRAIDIQGVMLFVVRGGELARRTDVWDSLVFMRQAGLAASD